MTCFVSCRSRYGVIPAEALRCGAKSSRCPLAPPGKHDEQRLFAWSRRKHPCGHSQVIQSTFCTDGPESLNSCCISATAHQEEFRRISGDGNLKEQSLHAWNSMSWRCRCVPGAGPLRAGLWVCSRCCHQLGTQDTSLLLCACVQRPPCSSLFVVN